MRSTRVVFGSLLALLGAAVFGGCSGLSRPYPDKNFYAISADQPATQGSATKPDVLRVETVRVTRPYDGLMFVYKIGDGKFATDYYNGFITSPDHMLTTQLGDWLAKSGPYSNVIYGDTGADARLSLESNVRSMYGDYSSNNQPSAVIEARFFLIDQSGGKFKILFDKTYSETEPLAGKSPQDLVKGWDRAYARMLDSLSTDLRSGVQ